jgi:hypothetical protein
MPQANLPLVTPDGYLKLQPITILDTRALPRKDEVVMQWLIQWQPPKQATWEDKLFIKGTFPDFYNHTLKAWWHDGASHGQEAAQRGGSCPTPANLGLPQEPCWVRPGKSTMRSYCRMTAVNGWMVQKLCYRVGWRVLMAKQVLYILLNVITVM